MIQKGNKKSRSILPDYIATNVESIDFLYLKKQGIKVCFFDLDHTLINHGTHDVSKIVLKTLKNVDMPIYIATNRKYTKNLDVVLQQINIKGLIHSELHGIYKPRTKYYKKMIELADVQPSNIVMIGDRVIQDTLGANRAGIYSVFVSKLGPVKWWDLLISIPDFTIPILFKKSYKDI